MPCNFSRNFSSQINQYVPLGHAGYKVSPSTLSLFWKGANDLQDSAMLLVAVCVCRVSRACLMTFEAPDILGPRLFELAMAIDALRARNVIQLLGILRESVAKKILQIVSSVTHI